MKIPVHCLSANTRTRRLLKSVVRMQLKAIVCSSKSSGRVRGYNCSGESERSPHRRSRSPVGPSLGVSERRHNSSFRLTRRRRRSDQERRRRRRDLLLRRSIGRPDVARARRQMRDGSDTALTDRPSIQWFGDFKPSRHPCLVAT